jgi:hypothetical protein
MKRAAIGLPLVFVLTLMPLANYANAPDDQEKPIASRDLKILEVPGKVAGVLWTVRRERCTLQIVFPSAGGMPKAKAYHPTLGLHAPFSVQAWLLRADGSAISSIGRSGPDEKTMGPRQPLGDEVLIAFPRSADAEAVAVALRVDDVFLIEKLPHVSG